MCNNHQLEEKRAFDRRQRVDHADVVLAAIIISLIVWTFWPAFV